MANLPEHTVSALTKGHEGVEVHPHGTVTFDGPDAVHLYRLHVIRTSLAFEVKTGMKMTRVSALKAANAALGTKYRRKQQALDHLNGLLSTFDEEE